MDEKPLSDLPDFDFEPIESESSPQAPASGSPGAATGAGEDATDVLGLELGTVDDEMVEETAVAGEIKDFFVSFMKTLRASQLYVQGNPLLHQFYEELHDRLGHVWTVEQTLSFAIHENEIRWETHPVYKGRPGGHENLAFQLYKDGIRRIDFRPGVEDQELQRFIDIIGLSRRLKEEEEDLLTLMWNADFQHLRYEYVDVLGDEPPLPSSGLPDVETTGDLPMMPELELSPELQAPTLREDFEPSLYFLDEADVAHLQQELLREWDRPVKRDVLIAMLDQFEMGDEERRGEIIEILRQMLPRVLAEGDFATAAFLVSELKGIGEKRGIPEVVEQVEGIIAELSQPIVISQLVRVLEDGSIDPKGDELATLLNALKPEAIEELIQAVPLITRPQAKEELFATLDRLASINPKLMGRLIRSEDPRVAGESAKIAARLKMAGSAEAIAALINRPGAEVRLAAVEALVALRTSMAGAPLLTALDDKSRDVRVAAAKGLAEMKYSPGAEKLEKMISGKELLKRDLTEQVAFFEAYALAAGAEGCRLLSRLLNGRRYLWVKYPGRTRACAARALGLIGSPEASEALATAEHDKDAMVLSAVHATRRGAGES
jgi:HEAT repeat protein